MNLFDLSNSMSLLAFVVTPAFAWAGLGLVSLPIIIHLLNRRRFRTIKWAAMEYLLAALRKNRRRLKFEQIILLATRCALLALLGLALARPLGCSQSALTGLLGSKSALHVFVIDNSYSMAFEADRPSAKTHLDQSKLLIKKQIDRLAQGGESVAIIIAARPKTGDDGLPANPIALQPSFDLEAARNAVDRIEQSYNGTDMLKAMQLAIQVAKEDQKQPQKFLYILTDSTRSAFETRQADLLKETGRQLEQAFGKNHIRYNDLGRSDQWNNSILDVRPDAALVTTNFHTDFLADIKGFGPAADTLVQWKWDDQIIEGGGRLKPDVSTELQRQTRAKVSAGGPHLLSVSLLNDERLKADNTRHRIVEVASELKVLIVEGSRGTGLLSGSGAFLEMALAPKREVGPNDKVRSDSYIAPDVISEIELGNKVLADYRAIILTDVSGVNAQQADSIARFVQNGGTLMLFMGDQVNADVYNSTLLPRKLLPGKLVSRKIAGDAKGFTFDFKPNGPMHPILSVFRGEEKSGLDTAPIFTYYQVELAPEAKAETILKYLAGEKETNDPAITRQALGKGFVVMVTTTANGDWNSLPPKPAYIALMHELLAGNVDTGEKWMNLTVGQPLEIPASLKFTGAPVLIDSLKRPIPVDAVANETGQTFYKSKAIEKPGVYSLNVGNMTIPIAVNIPSDEADIRHLPADAIRKALGDIEIQMLTDTLPDALTGDEGSDYGWTIMALLLLPLLGLECYMAMKFGHYRRPGLSPAPVAAKPAAI